LLVTIDLETFINRIDYQYRTHFVNLELSKVQDLIDLEYIGWRPAQYKANRNKCKKMQLINSKYTQFTGYICKKMELNELTGYNGLLGRIIKKEKNMNNLLTIIILGLYTLVYVIVFVIQKSQIDKQKEIINSMKVFSELIKVGELEKFVELSKENMRIKLENDLDKLTKQAFRDSDLYFRTLLEKEIKNKVENFDLQYNEISKSLVLLILDLPKDERLNFIQSTLPLTKELFIKNLKVNNDI